MSRRLIEEYLAIAQQGAEAVGGCWLWPGRLTHQGYPRTGRGLAHHVIYERLVGPIPTGLELHHKCERRSCVNPAHLEPVRHGPHVSAHKVTTSCVHGHPWSAENTYYQAQPLRGGRVRRSCRACGREAARRYVRRRNRA